MVILDCLNMYKIYAYNYENCTELIAKMRNEKHPFIKFIENLESTG